MSAYSTLRITKSKAKQALVEHFMQDIDAGELERFMDKILEPRLYNAMIVSDDCENDDEMV